MLYTELISKMKELNFLNWKLQDYRKNIIKHQDPFDRILPSSFICVGHFSVDFFTYQN